MSCTNKKKILEIEELSVSFLQYKGKTSRQSWLPVISGLSVAVREGELVAVVGSSGSEKVFWHMRFWEFYLIMQMYPEL